MADPRLAVLQRTYDRARRGRDLKDWGLRPQPPDPGSSLALDDDRFMAELGGLVNITALFPIMNATDNLAAVADLIESRPKTRNSYTASLLTLCRAAVEAAAKTIWLLCEPDRTVRRARCIGFTDSELAAQRGFHAVERRRFQTQPDRDRDPNCLKFLKHVELFEQRIGMMGGHKREKAPSFSGFVAKAGKWVDEHGPPMMMASCAATASSWESPGSTSSALGSCTATSGPWITSRPVSWRRFAWSPMVSALRSAWSSVPWRYTKRRPNDMERRLGGSAFTRIASSRRLLIGRRSTLERRSGVAWLPLDHHAAADDDPDVAVPAKSPDSSSTTKSIC